MTDFDNRLNMGWLVLKIGLGVGPIIAGKVRSSKLL